MFMKIAPGLYGLPLRPVRGLAVIEQNAAETLRIVGVGEFARTRQMEIVKPRNPESQRPRAQHPWPGIALLIGKRPHCGVRLQQRLGACRVSTLSRNRSAWTTPRGRPSRTCCA